jgi:flagellar biosynthesis GTPase FlhF
MGRDSFIFYRSFAEAIDDLPDSEQLEIYRAIKEYALNENEPELTGVAKSFWTLIKPQITANNRRYKNGCKGGKPPKKVKSGNNQNVTKQKPNSNLDETKAEPNTEPEKNQKRTRRKPNENDNENVNLNENGNENDSCGSAEPPDKKPVSKNKPDKPKKPPLRERDPVNDMERVEKAYLQNWDTLYSQGRVTTPDPVVNWSQTRKLLKNHFGKLKPEQIIKAINNGLKDEFTMNGGYSLSMMLSASMLNKLINSAQGELPVSKHRQEKLTLE